MSRAGAVGGAGLLAAGSLLFGVPVLMLMSVVAGGGGGAQDDGCGIGPAVLAAGAAGDRLDEDQLANAAVIVSVGNRLGVPRRGVIVALAVASQESRFLNYANDGEGDDLSWIQQGIDQSLALPHQAVGTDHGSLGVFQQQWPWWGTMQELLDPATAAAKFYTALLAVPGWQSMTVTQAGQAVQNSAYPDAYADDEALAVQLLTDPAAAGGTAISAAAFTASSGDCVTAAIYPGTVAFPLPATSAYQDLANWHHTGSHWTHGHTGTDLSAACGTPVLAATDGIVIVRQDQPWSGEWLVQVSTGAGRLTTWYGHMQALAVRDGDRVTAGQQIGEVGALGNASGCHLHFEVHPHGGSIYQDDVDPTAWLLRNVGHDLGGVVPASAGSGEFVLATFNVLGHSHTVPGGERKGWAASGSRMHWAVQLLDQYAVDVVGLQEFQRPQKRAFLQLAGDRYAVYSPAGDTENSIAWRRTRWTFVKADTFTIPYFDGHRRRMPVVMLSDRASGEVSVFVNVHNPADTARFHHQQPFRNEAIRREVALIRELETRYQVPIYLTGDLNDRDSAFCSLTTGGLLQAAAGGNTDKSCQPPAYHGIDWILGTSLTRFGAHTVVRDSLVSKTTDHPLVLARATSAGGS